MDHFVVSARKYRPATFVSVVGQKHITSTLKNAISRSQLAHAYLFCGPRGVGKTTCARIFAKAINCLSPVDSEACNECESCRSFNEGRSFNIHELDAASNNSVDDIRSLTDQVRIPPQIGRYSVYIIDEVHMLSAAAFNAFLKTLEEPPAHAVFILATTEKHKIIPTILSRCQIFDFNRIRVEDSVEYLKYIAGEENVAYDDESLHLISMKADGGMRDALSMFDKAVSFCGTNLEFKEVARTLNVLDYDTYFQLTDSLGEGDYPTALTIFDEVLKQGFSPQVFVSGLNAHFRDLLMCKSPQTANLLEVSGTLLEKYREQAAHVDTGFMFNAISLLTAVDGTLRTASSQRLNVELALMKICSSAQKKTPLTNGESSNTLLATDVADGSSGSSGLPEIVKTASARPQTQNVRPEVSKPVANTDITPEVNVRVAGADNISTGKTPENKANSSAEKLTPSPVDSQPETSETVPSASQQTPEETAPSQPASAPVRESRAAIHAMSQTISGTSIQLILNTPKSELERAVSSEEAKADVSIDPETQMKIETSKNDFIVRLRQLRPRIAVAMEAMQVDGHTVRVSVPSETLYEEIMRNATELLGLMAEISGIDGFIDLKVEVKEDTNARKPIKAEDKLKFLTEQNPNLQILKQKLNLEIE